LTGYGFILVLCVLAIFMASRIASERRQAEDGRRMKTELERRVAGRTAELTQTNELLRAEVVERERAERKFRELLESAPDAIVIADQKGRIVLVNSQAERWFGYARGELIGQPVEVLLPERFRQRHVGHRAGYLAAPRTRLMGGGLELFGQRKDGSEFPVEISLSPIETTGGVWVTSIIRDITERQLMESERRASEARFRAVADTANDAIISADSLSRVIYFNKAAERIFGYTTGEILHQPLTLLMPPRFHAAHEQGLKRFLAGGESRVIGKTVELAGKRKNSEEFPLELSLSTWKVSEEIFFTALIRDITQRRLVEERIRQLNENLEQRAVELEAINHEIEAFSYSVSHDLRAPLRAIDGFSQALLEDCAERLDDQGRQYLQRVRNATQRMGTLIDDLLMLSRVTRSEMRRELMDLTQLAQSVIAGLEIIEPGRKVECQMQAGMVMDGDPRLMRIVLENLLGNAWKFTQRANPARIEVGSRTGDAGVPVYFVHDNGVGFDMTYVDKLFGAFQRLHATSDFPGTGIGLATVQRVIHRHGGRVWAEGETGKGASFYFTLGPSTRSSPQENPP
jgi:PAS domain S-box-containing protein